ncbi:MAG: hypothetical protein VKK04_13635 [Synechococcales bacterium]|nr:hypothetical protein [Synechococcales bacterium]
MLDERLTKIQSLLVIQLDKAAAAAIAILQESQPHLSLKVLEVREDSDSSVSFVVSGDVPLTFSFNSQMAIIQWLREQGADAVVILTGRGRSPYCWAYRCYLAGIPIRIGQSSEFGGQVLSHPISLPDADVADPYYLLQSCGLINAEIQTTPL